MDLAAKKSELLDWLLHLKDESKLKKLIAFKSIIDNEVSQISDIPVYRRVIPNVSPIM